MDDFTEESVFIGTPPPCKDHILLYIYILVGLTSVDDDAIKHVSYCVS